MSDLVASLLDGIASGQRAAIARAITLVESTAPKHRATARDLLTRLTKGDAVRVGISEIGRAHV
jgi:LAO/AO transport system kinase